MLRKNYYTSKIEQHKYDLKNTWKVLKGAIGKTHKTIEIEKISFEGKEVTEKSKSQNYAMSTLSLLVISLPKVYNPVMSNLQLPISKQLQ